GARHFRYSPNREATELSRQFDRSLRPTLEASMGGDRRRALGPVRFRFPCPEISGRRRHSQPSVLEDRDGRRAGVLPFDIRSGILCRAASIPAIELDILACGSADCFDGWNTAGDDGREPAAAKPRNGQMDKVR